jgi:replicative DNA helicase
MRIDAADRNRGTHVPSLETQSAEAFLATQTQKPIWGVSASPIWSAGEPFYVVGDTGVGKTTLVQGLSLARLRGDEGFLGLPLRAAKRILYVAADRQAQVRRSLSRMVLDDDEAILRGGLSVHPGPLPYNFAIDGAADRAFEDFMSEGVDAVVFDSLKDIAGDLSNEETGAQVNRLFQLLCASDVDVLTLHHLRKGSSDQRKGKGVNDVYGSMYLMAGAGSVLLLTGTAGSHVRLTQLKAPADPIPPTDFEIDRESGQFIRHEPVDPVDVVLQAQHPMDVTQIANLAIGREGRPATTAEIQSCRRKLRAASDNGRIRQIKGGKDPDTKRQLPDLWARP